MTTVPAELERIFLINAHPRFYIDWVDHLDEIYRKINRWIDKVNLQGDREEMQRIVAWMVPCLCTESNEHVRFCERGIEHFQSEWKHILDGLNRLYRDDPLHRFVGLRKDDLERKIELAKKQSNYFMPKRGRYRKTLDQGLDFLIWRMEELGKTATEQRYATLELFKSFNFANFPRMSHSAAYRIIDRIRKEALSQPRTPFDPLKPGDG